MPPQRPLSIATSLALVGTLSLGATPTVRAAGPPSPGPSAPSSGVMVWPTRAGAPTATVEAALSEAGHTVVPFAPVAEALAQGRAVREAALSRMLADVDAGLARVQEHYLAQSWTQMQAEVGQLEDAALPALARADGDGCGRLWALQFWAGLGYGARKAEGDAVRQAEHFGMALALDADRRPLADLYGPDVSAAFVGVADDRVDVPPRPVPIEVTPSDARVTIDCRTLPADHAVTLRPGRHAVLAEAPGFSPRAQIIEVGVQGAITIVLARDPTTSATQRLAHTWPDDGLNLQSASHAQAAADIAESMGVARWVGLVPTADGTRAALFVGAEVKQQRTRADGADAAQAVLAAVSPPSTPRDVGRPDPVVGPDRGGRDVERKPLVRRWWFWVAVVGAAAATGVGLGVGLSQRSRAPTRLQVKVR